MASQTGHSLYFHHSKRPQPTLQATQQRQRYLAELPERYQPPIEQVKFVGRQDAIAQCVEVLEPAFQTEGDPVVVAIVGAAGVGKSSLAIHLAHQLKAQVTETRYIDFCGTPTRSLHPDEVLASWQPLETRSLLVLDNVDHAAQVEAFLMPAVCAILVTSRKPLTLENAIVLDLDCPTEQEAQALMQQLAGIDRFRTEPNAMSKLIERCDHLPLAMSLAGGTLASRSNLSVQQYVNQLSDEKARSQSQPFSDPIVRSTFALSYQMLTPTAAKLLRLLGVLAETAFTPSIAAVLLECERDKANAAIQELAAHRLIALLAQERYQIAHDLIRLYARTQLAIEETMATRHAARLRLCYWYLEATAMMTELQDVAVRNWFETERLNLLTAIEWMYQAEAWNMVLRLAENLSFFFDQRDHSTAGQQTVLLALDAATRLNDRHQAAQMHNTLGNLYLRQGDWQKAEEQYKQSLQRFEQVGDAVSEAQTLINLGVLHLQQDHKDAALLVWKSAIAKLSTHPAESRTMQRWMQSIDIDLLEAAGGAVSDRTIRPASSSFLQGITTALRRLISE